MSRYDTSHMAKSREIKGRIKAVGNIRRITKTMQMIATAKYQAASRRVTAGKPYAEKIRQLVGDLSAAGAKADHPLLAKPAEKTGKHLILLLTSNRGLCGAYNANILRRMTLELEALADRGEEADIDLVGKKGRAFLKFRGIEPLRFLSDINDEPKYEQVEPLADSYMDWYMQGKYDTVRIVYMAYHSAGKQAPEVATLLPMENPVEEVAGDGDEAVSGGATAAADYDFSPEPSELLNELLPITARLQLFQCFIEASVSEHIARMIAMKAATDAAGDLSKILTRKYNRVRQAAITTELNEIVSGANAIAG